MSTDGSGSGSVARGSSGGRRFAICGVVFLVASVIAAIMNVRAPFARGWWLVAYLSLVGGVAQLLLGPGLIALANRHGWHGQSLRYSVAELVLWNIGTLTVAIADLALAPGGVVAGSVLLVVALALFARELNHVSTVPSPPARAWRGLYVLLLVFLAVSTIVGTILAYRSTAL